MEAIFDPVKQAERAALRSRVLRTHKAQLAPLQKRPVEQSEPAPSWTSVDASPLAAAFGLALPSSFVEPRKRRALPALPRSPRSPRLFTAVLVMDCAAKALRLARTAPGFVDASPAALGALVDAFRTEIELQLKTKGDCTQQ